MQPFTIYNRLTEASISRLTGMINVLQLPEWSKPYPIHHTLIYSKEPPDDAETPFLMQYLVSVKVTGAAILGDAIVLLFESPSIIRNRFDTLHEKYGHSFPNLLSHVSIYYTPDENSDDPNMTAEMLTKVFEYIRNTNLTLELSGEVLDLIDADKASDLNSDEAKKQKSPREQFLTVMHKYLSDHETPISAWGQLDIDKFKDGWKRLSNYMVRELRTLADEVKKHDKK